MTAAQYTDRLRLHAWWWSQECVVAFSPELELCALLFVQVIKAAREKP